MSFIDKDEIIKDEMSRENVRPWECHVRPGIAVADSLVKTHNLKVAGIYNSNV